MKTGMILEGGAMRGMYTAGVLDVMLENDIWVDGYIGVSAGAIFGCNYKSKQIGRIIRYTTTYSKDPRYSSLKSWRETGNLYNVEFCYHTIPEKYDLFDEETFRNNPIDFYVVCTDIHTGKPVYHLCNVADAPEVEWMRASAAMPLASKPVCVDGYEMLDGGISDSIPISWFMKKGYEKNIIILTQHDGYQKKKSKMQPLFKLFLKDYPAVAKCMERRHLKYNASVAKVKKLEKMGKALVIQPSEKLKISRTEKDPDKLWEVYYLGRKDALSKLEVMKAFVKKEN